MHAFELLGELQAFVVVRADGENRDDGGDILAEQFAQQDEELLGSPRLGKKQFLALVDRYDQRWRLRPVSLSAAIGVALSASACKSGSELRRAAIDGGAHFGARHRHLGGGKCRLRARTASPASPNIAARSGRMIGNGRKFRSSRARRGNRPARRNEDLPAPDAPRMTRSRGEAPHACHAGGQAPRRSLLRGRKNAGILGFKRAQATIGWSVRIIWRRPPEILGIEAGVLQSLFEALQALGRKGDMHLLMRDRQHRRTMT